VSEVADERRPILCRHWTATRHYLVLYRKKQFSEWLLNDVGMRSYNYPMKTVAPALAWIIFPIFTDARWREGR
jgi:hypothetical protein